MLKGNVKCVLCGDVVFSRWIEVDDFGCDMVMTRPEKPFLYVFGRKYICEECILKNGWNPDVLGKATRDCQSHAWNIIAE